MATAREREPLINAGLPTQLVDVDPEPLAEIAVRLGTSFVLMPDSVITAGDEKRTRETIRALIAPVLNR